MKPFELTSSRFRAEREEAWKRLETLMEQANAKGFASLETEDVFRLVMLYRATLSSLSVARAISLDRRLLLYLEDLSRRVYTIFYGAHVTPTSYLKHYFQFRLPRAMRQAHPYIAIAFLFYAVGFYVGWSFVTSGLVSASNYHEGAGLAPTLLYVGEPEPAEFFKDLSMVVLIRSAKLGLLAFGFGAVGGIPTLLISGHNGIDTGLRAGLLAAEGEAAEFWAWVALHNVVELSGFLLCCAGGLVLGKAVLFPRRLSRARSLREHGALATELVVGGLLFVIMDFVIDTFFGFQGLAVSIFLGLVQIVFIVLYASSGPKEPADASLRS